MDICLQCQMGTESFFQVKTPKADVYDSTVSTVAFVPMQTSKILLLYPWTFSYSWTTVLMDFRMNVEPVSRYH